MVAPQLIAGRYADIYDWLMLFHISEEANIRKFEPRPSSALPDPAVWAIDAAHLRNYLLPRDCPRVTFYPTDTSSGGDVRQFLGHHPSVVAIENACLERIRSARLYRYWLPEATFECLDAGAGYFISRVAVTPTAVDVISDLLSAIAATGADIRTVDDLWPLHDAVARSSLQFSMIRMHNAQPRRHPHPAA